MLPDYIQVSQEAGQVVWYSQLLKNFPQFIVVHTVKGFGTVIKAEIDVFLKLCCFFDDLNFLRIPEVSRHLSNIGINLINNVVCLVLDSKLGT